MTLIDRMKNLKDGGIPFARATVVRADTSTPRKAGAEMIVTGERIIGTIGGGVVEKMVEKAARDMLNTGELNRLVDLSLEAQTGEERMSKAGDPVETGAICGGVMSVFIQCYHPAERLILAGGGHIALALYNISRGMDLAMTVVDNRADFASKERFPEAEVIQGDYFEVFSSVPLISPSYILIITHGHRHDDEVLAAITDRDWKNVRYVGMIGSKKKVESCLWAAAEGGSSREKLAMLSTPVGLDIGAVTPEEIAVSIMAEIIARRRGKDEADIGFMNRAREIMNGQ